MGQYGGTGSGLWKTDGTEAGPILIKNFYPRNLTAVGSTLYFTADDGTSGDELWKLDTYINEPPTNILLSNHNIVENYRREPAGYQ